MTNFYEDNLLQCDNRTATTAANADVNSALTAFTATQLKAKCTCDTYPACINTTTGIDSEIEMSSVVIYPNPSTNIFNIRNSENIVSLKVINVYGQTVLSQTENVSSQFALGDEFADGAYSLVMYDKQGIAHVKRIVKTK